MIRCSIVIPTYNRPSYLKRILNYYNDSRVVCHILIADGSSDEVKELNRKAVSSFPSLEIQHLKYPFETPPQIRFADALKYVNTGYCVFCADDDFITPNGILRSVDFLEGNLDFVAAHGRYIVFHLKKRGEKPQFWWHSTYAHESIAFLKPETRLSNHLSDYSQTTFYAVHRTDILRKIWAESVKYTFDSLFELLLSMLTLIYGKLKCLDVLYSGRDDTFTAAGGYRPTLRDTIATDAYYEEYATFREYLSAHLNKQSELDMEESRQLVDKGMAAYINKYFPPKTKKRIFLDHLHLPNSIDKTVVKASNALFRKPTSPVLPKYELFADPASPLSEYDEELGRIRFYVVSHSKSTYGTGD